ncbi:MAG TPA: FGGY-family carbohydrate kinase, partial [Acidimicrobiia bacterium]|nr:FGGY-family carbohydrate kinase [Acidimicrobiia bacterium]
LHPLGPGILWSDRRAGAEAAALGDPAAFRAATGVVLDGGAHAAKLAWVARHTPDVLRGARWVLAPRDHVIARLTGVVVTDDTLASRTGLAGLDGDGGWLPEARTVYGARLPPVVAPTHVVGTVIGAAAAELGLPRDRAVHVVAGAGDRACEVLGTGASATAPMVSWGTTANVSVPHDGPVGVLPTVAAVSRGARGGFLVEAGLSGAGEAVAWLAALTGRTHDDLLADAASAEPGAGGALALPWLGGARAPWWRNDVRAEFSNLSLVHGPPHIARALVEGIALDVARCLELVAPARAEVAAAGAGAADDLWRQVLAAVTGLPVTRRALDDAASVGARLVVGAALGEACTVDEINPLTARDEPDPGLLAAYREVRAAADAAALSTLSAR